MISEYDKRYETIINNYGHKVTTFKSVLFNHTIKLELNQRTNEALIKEMQIKHDEPVELAMLLVDIMNILKKDLIETVTQRVTENDWITILKPDGIFECTYINKMYDFVNVRCKIDNFPEAVMKALGFNKNNDTSESSD